VEQITPPVREPASKQHEEDGPKENPTVPNKAPIDNNDTVNKETGAESKPPEVKRPRIGNLM
jgi:hypothetical protein